MVTKKATKTKEKKASPTCEDKFCPVHGEQKLRRRGRVFEGTVIKKLPGRVTIQFERILKLSKYERYEKRKTKIHARLPDCMADEVSVGDLIEVAETRPISKMIHTVVTKTKKESKK
ncbi:30S ribosomal protein S17 [Candidatus Pacearchaeota archaeon]|nr:30S ribosomal protein S17 [Candidatus Pacearchaeota archaeon]|tara:strand:+ start:26245 stop:26595 length:351 start_codon:yes stop_codon:yes gene_type:complete